MTQTTPISEAAPLFLGSGSPRRRDILRGLGIPIEVRAANTDEAVGLREPAAFLERVVEDKRVAAWQLSGGRFPAVLVADTIVVLDGEILGKPQDTSDALRLITRLAGRVHEVFTRYAIATGERTVARTVRSLVTMREAPAQLLERYALRGEGLDKAGAYAVQGIGAFLVRSIEGSYSNVVGLPACEVVQDLEGLGLLRNFP